MEPVFSPYLWEVTRALEYAESLSSIESDFIHIIQLWKKLLFSDRLLGAAFRIS
jgi:hypothetical protein